MKERSPFNPKIVYGLIVVGIAAFAAIIWVMAYGGPEPRQQKELSRAQMMSPAAVGFKGLVELVGQVRQAYVINSTAELDFDDLLVLAIDENSRSEDLSWVRQRRAARPTLIILPKWRTVANRRGGDWVTAIGPGAGNRLAMQLGYRLAIRDNVPPGSRATGTNFLVGTDMVAPALPQVIEGEGLVPLLTLPNGGALLAQIEGRPHYILADPDLLNNHGISDPARASAAIALLDALNATDAQSINFATFTDVAAVARESASLLRLVLEPPFLAMTLALIVAALLAGFHGAIRFGQPRREERTIALGKAALVENSAGLIRLARREVHMSTAYAEFIQQETARAVGAPPELSGEALDEYLDRLTRSGPTFSELATALEKTRDRESMAAAARALFQWKKDIIR
ncbi:MAG TPA: hypothetical protein VEC11_10595 [Allosphingosinicella sp.]|nr:hypothetical protein [Allosphingosinicella sp.]